MSNRNFFVVLIVMIISISLKAQTDSLTFHNGNYIVGESKNPQ